MNPSRRPNRRGQGTRLRGDIVAGAVAVLEETGNEDAVTLRAVARKIGIAAPSIYGHFADRDEMMLAVVGEIFDELDAALVSAASAHPDDELHAVCMAYVEFATSSPHRYRVLFARHRSGPAGPLSRPRPVEELAGARAFSRLVAAIAHHRGEDPAAVSSQAAIGLWISLHGYVTLRAAVPAFPWPPEEDLLRELISRNI